MRKIFVVFLCFALCGCYCSEINEEQCTEETLNETETESFYGMEYISNLSNEVKNWGMRRNLPDRPEFTSEQKEMMDKYGCIYMGDDVKKYLYLTFDEGYENGQTERILDTLKEKGVKAAFFITGDYLKTETELVDRMVNEGHTVGNHTMNHPCMPKLKNAEKMQEEAWKLDRAFYGRYKKHMEFFRPPEGAYSEKSLCAIKEAGYTSVFWSFAYDDWYRDKIRGWEYAYNKTIENIHPGCVILLHAVSKDNADALGRIIEKAQEDGYMFLPLTQYIP